jgi:NADH-quinone oxidoreductase subunit E
MAPGKAKTRSRDSKSTRKKSKSNPAYPIGIEKEVEGGDELLTEDVLTRVSGKLGIPIHQVSRMVATVQEVTRESDYTDRIIDEYKGDKTALIQVLLEIQRENRWLAKDVLTSVCEKLGVPLSRAYRVATFYKAFSLKPQGRHRISVCMGTACHVRNSPRLLDRVTDAVNIKPGETSADLRFSLETVNCLGCCALGPVMVVDGEYHSNPSPKEIGRIADSCA